MERVSPSVADSSPGGAARAMRRVAAAVAIVAAVVAITMIVSDGQPAQVRKRMACSVPRDHGVARHAARTIHTAYLATRGWRGRGAARRDCRTAQDDPPLAKPLARRRAGGRASPPAVLTPARPRIRRLSVCFGSLPRYVFQEPFAATQSMTKDDVGKMFEGEDEFGDYPEWTKTVDQINEQVCRIAAAAAAARAGAQPEQDFWHSLACVRVSVPLCWCVRVHGRTGSE
jgi:hypothetical protein